MNVTYNFNVETLQSLDNYLDSEREKGHKISKSRKVENMVKFAIANKDSFLIWEMSGGEKVEINT